MFECLLRCYHGVLNVLKVHFECLGILAKFVCGWEVISAL